MGEKLYRTSQLLPGDRVVTPRWIHQQHGHRYWLSLEANVVAQFVTWVWNAEHFDRVGGLPGGTWFLDVTWRLCKDLQDQTDLGPPDITVDVLRALKVGGVILPDPPWDDGRYTENLGEPWADVFAEIEKAQP